MVDQAAASRLADAITAHHAVEAQRPPPAVAGWAHLPVSLVDTVFSLQARYSGDGEVFGPVRRYAEWAASELGCYSGSLLSGIREEASRRHTVSEMVALLDPLSTDERVAVFGSRRPAYTSVDAPRRADTVVEAARALAGLGIETRLDFERHHAEPDSRSRLRAAWLGVPGFGKRSWEYVALVCGLPAGRAPLPRASRAS